MEERMIETLTRRLERVERTNRRLQGVGALGLAALAMVGVMGQTAPKQVLFDQDGGAIRKVP